MAEDPGVGGDCVYVTRALLDALERDKRALKWELARASKAADARAAQLAACEAQVKDLMTIVEMNKSVAHRAVQRGYAKEGVLQRLHRERVQLQTRVETQHRRALEALARRAAQRRQRDALHTWARAASLERLRRVAVRRVARSRRRHALQYGFAQWRRLVRVGTSPDLSALVYPISPLEYSYAVPEKARPRAATRATVRFALSPTSSTKNDATTSKPALPGYADSSRKSLSFATWKAQWLAHKRWHATATHFARLMLAKRVLSAWKHVVRRRNWRDAMVKTAVQRRRYQCFDLWASWAKRRRRARLLLAKIATRATRRWVRRAFVQLRVRCLEKCLMEWGDVLKDARQAIDEERRMYALQQNEAMLEIEQKALREQTRQARLVEAQLEAMQKKQQTIVLTKYVAKWRRLVALRALQTRIAREFHSHRKRGRVVQKLFYEWRATTRQSRAVARFRDRRASRETARMLTRAFTLFTATTKLAIRRKQALRRILRGRRIVLSSRAFWKLCGAIAVADEQVHAQLQQRHLVNRLEIRERASQNEGQRLRRVGYKYQMKCALVMGDIKRERSKRKVFCAWKARAEILHQRKRALRKRLASIAIVYMDKAFTRWHTASNQYLLVQKALLERTAHQRRQLMSKTFTAWRTTSLRQLTMSAQGSLQLFVLLLWRKRSDVQRSRRAALVAMLKFHLRYRWAKPAFERWRRKVEVAMRIERRQRSHERELVRHTFHCWARWYAHRSRQRQLQFKTIAYRAEAQTRRRLLLVVWIAWRDHVRVVRQSLRGTEWLSNVAVKSRRQRQLRTVWQLWVRTTSRRIDQRAALNRIHKRHHVTGATRNAWHRWTAFVARANGVRTGMERSEQRSRQASTTRLQRHSLRRFLREWHRTARMRRQARLVADQQHSKRRRVLLATCWTSWRRDFVPVMRFRRVLLRGIVDAHRKTRLRVGIQTWKRQCEQLAKQIHHQHVSTYRIEAQSRALVFLRRLWGIRDLRSSFFAWQEYCKLGYKSKQVLTRLVHEKSIGLLRLAWRKMMRRVDAYATMRNMAAIWMRSVLRQAWARLYVTGRERVNRRRAAHRLFAVIKRAVMRLSWSQWRRSDHALVISRITQTHVATNTALQAFMERVGVRQFSKSLSARVFGRWKAHATRQRALRRRVMQLLIKQDSVTVKRCFHAWASERENQHYARRLLSKMLMRKAVSMERLGWMKLRAFVVETAHQAKLLDARRQLEAHREAVARRVAMTLFSSWQKPSLTSVFRAWKEVVDSTQRSIQELLVRQRSRQMQDTWTQWREEVASRKVVRSTLRAVVDRQQRRAMALAWRAWQSRVAWLEVANTTIRRLVASVRRRLLRSGWRCLRLHQDMVMRRQSIMVVVSAQQQLDQQKELQRLRNIAFMLQRHQKGRLRELFVRWRDFTSAQRERLTIVAAVSRRYNRRMTRVVLRSWRGVISHKRTQARRIEKWQNTQCRHRLMRVIWRAWHVFVARRCEARYLVQHLLETRATRLLTAAWRTWVDVVEEQVEAERVTEIANWRRATTMQQNQVASLEAKTELLLLESVELKRAAHTHRQRCAQALVRKIIRVLDVAMIRQVRARWDYWALQVETRRAAQWLAGKVQTLREREAFLGWKQEAQLRKWTHHEAQMLDKVAVILGASSVLLCKKSAWRQWTAYVRQRRVKRTQHRVVAMLRRRQGDGTILQRVFSCWKTLVRDSKQRYASAIRMETVHRHKVLRRALGAWHEWRETQRGKREALLMLCRIGRAIERRCLQLKWLRWRNWMAETAIVVAESHVVLMQTETAEREEKLHDQSRLLRIFTAWRETAAKRRMLREDRCLQREGFGELWAKRRVMDAWRWVLHASKLRQARNGQPVLCVRPHATKRSHATAAENGAVLSFREYVQHRRRTHWRVELSHRVTQARMRRLFGLMWLLRSLRRQHLKAQRRALWRWFAKIQPISCALHAVSFAELPWRRADVDFAGSMLLLTLEELDLQRQTHRTEQTQRAWSVVDAIARSQQRQAVRRAFDKWRWGRQKRPASVRGALAPRQSPTTANTERTRARACIAQLRRVHLRHAFARWKSAYLALAIQQAQAEYDALQAALTQTAMRRRAMDA